VLGTAVIPGSGEATVNRSGLGGRLTTLGLAGDEFAIKSHIPVTDPNLFPIIGFQFTASNGAGAFSDDGDQGLGGVMPIQGSMKVCLFGSSGCSYAAANITVPISVVGQGGVAHVTGPVNLTVVGAPWTTGTAAIGANTVMGGTSPPNTGAPLGNSVSLVTPVFISTNVPYFPVLPTFGRLSLHFIPEPGTLLLAGTAIASLVAIGIARSRRTN
jgi:hypothetical protein